MMLATLFILAVAIAIGDASPVIGGQETIGGNAKGAPCQFPFTYRDEVYWSCTTVNNDGEEWCYTTTPGKWGNCKHHCRSNVETTGGTAGGDSCCIFPFTYKGVSYDTCTSVGHTQPWCYATTNMKKWGNCVDVCLHEGAQHRVGEQFTSAKTCSNCHCTDHGQVACVPLCPPRQAQCKAGQKVEYDTVETVAGCPCQVPKCVNDKCSFEGNDYTHGQTFISTKKCATCTCEMPQGVTCIPLCPPRMVSCPVGEKIAYQMEDTAAPGCSCKVPKCVPDTCTYEGKTFNHGELFHSTTKCATCNCNMPNGVTCIPACPPVAISNCPVGQKVEYESKDSAVAGCPCKVPKCVADTCNFEGHEYKQGESFISAKQCQACSCNSHGVICLPLCPDSPPAQCHSNQKVVEESNEVHPGCTCKTQRCEDLACPEMRIAYPGNDIGAKRKANSWQECSSKCRTEPRCLFWTYTTSSKKCLLKTSSSGRTGGKYKISGARGCGQKDCPKENGFCNSPGLLGWGLMDQNAGVVKLYGGDIKSVEEQAKCVAKCHAHTGATGCEAAWENDNRGCYAHTEAVAKGSGATQHACWVFSKCLTTGHEPEGDCAGLYTCQWQKTQSGYDIAHTKETSRDACAKKCCANVECTGFDWDTVTNDCWLSESLWAEIPLTDHEDRWACEEKPSECAKKYTCEWNKSQYGNDISNTKETTRELCAEKCCAHDECIGFDWDSDSDDCWLSKTSWTAVPTRTHNNRWACESAGHTSEPQGQCAALYTCQWQKTQSGYDIAHTKETSRDACSEKCCADPECTGFDWDTVSHDCWLSEVLWAQIPLTDHSDRWACERTPGECSKKYTCEWNKSQYGNDIANTKETTRELCAEKCCATNECIGFDWDSDSDDCWLSKTSWASVATIAHNNRWACEKTVSCPDVNINYPGNNIKYKRDVKTWQECSAYCATITGCKVWTFNKRNVCYAKSGSAKRGGHVSAISGSKSCKE